MHLVGWLIKHLDSSTHKNCNGHSTSTLSGVWVTEPYCSRLAATAAGLRVPVDDMAAEQQDDRGGDEHNV